MQILSMEKVSISLYLDKRRAKKNGKYPVKLRVYDSFSRKQKQLGTKFDLDEISFFQAYESKRTKAAYKDLKYGLTALENRAVEVANEINPFSFDEFEKRLFRKKGEGANVVYHLNLMTKAKIAGGGSIKTARSYQSSIKSLDNYTNCKLKKSFDKFSFYDIDVDFLKNYEHYMVEEKGCSLATVGLYLRNIRTAFNEAISQKDIDSDISPFGKRKYIIPSVKGRKNALTSSELTILFEATPSTPQQVKAKDLWFFLYGCHGMNLNDVVRLKVRDYDEKNGCFSFYRGKTKNTSRGNLKEIKIFLHSYCKQIIEKYRASHASNDDYLFSFYNRALSEEAVVNEVEKLTRFVNTHFKKFAKDNGIEKTVSTNVSRHSFATISINGGKSFEFMQESLGHKDLKTTQNYFAGFDDETKKEFAEKLMDF